MIFCLFFLSLRSITNLRTL